MLRSFTLIKVDQSTNQLTINQTKDPIKILSINNLFLLIKRKITAFLIKMEKILKLVQVMKI